MLPRDSQPLSPELVSEQRHLFKNYETPGHQIPSLRTREVVSRGKCLSTRYSELSTATNLVVSPGMSQGHLACILGSLAVGSEQSPATRFWQGRVSLRGQGGWRSGHVLPSGCGYLRDLGTWMQAVFRAEALTSSSPCIPSRRGRWPSLGEGKNKLSVQLPTHTFYIFTQRTVNQ